MEEKIITLTIEKLAGLGDGAGLYEGRKTFVPYTLPGDVVRAKITRETVESLHAVPVEIITPSPDRAAPVCRHFSVCGGCALQHMRPDSYAAFKQKMAEEAVRKAGYDASLVAPLVSIPAASRRRAEFKIENGKLGFYEEQSRSLVDIKECPVLEPALFALVMRIRERLLKLAPAKLHINGVDKGYDAVIDCAEDKLPDFADCPELLRLTHRKDKKLRTVFVRAPVTLTLGGVSVHVPPGAFLQAAIAAQEAMTAVVSEAVGEAKNLLDLFAGLGAFSFPLAQGRRVTAIEGEASMVGAMAEAASRHHLGKNFRAERRDLFVNPVSALPFDAVIVNPPRQGAKAQCEKIAASKAPCIAMVSCNPATFARDAHILRDGGYALISATPIDQFVYSPHLELVAHFTK